MIERRTFLASMMAASVTASLAKPAGAAGRVPFKLFDTHAHLYSSDADHYPFKADVAAAARAKAAAHPVTPEALFRMWDAAGVEMGCGVQYNTTYSTDNRYLFDSAAAHPKRIVPVAIVDPLDAAAPETMARMVRDNHISGVRFAGPPDASGNFTFLSDEAGKAWTAANALQLVVVLMPFKSNLPQAMTRIGALAARYPDLTIVIDHIGFPSVAAGDKFGLSPAHIALAAHRNVNFKYTTLLLEELARQGVPAPDFLKFVVDLYGANRLVWGSDVGNTEGDYTEFVTRAVDSARHLAVGQQKAIFYETAKRLFVPRG